MILWDDAKRKRKNRIQMCDTCDDQQDPSPDGRFPKVTCGRIRKLAVGPLFIE